MKLVFCLNCHDLFRLTIKSKICECGESGGYYLSDGLNATVWGKGLPIGFSNNSFVDAINNRPKEGMGSRFEAFVIPKKCPTVVEKKKRPRNIQTVERDPKDHEPLGVGFCKE